MVATNPMVSATSVWRGLELLPDSAAKISPSKQRLVASAVSAARLRALQPFSHGEKLDGDEGSLTRLSEKIFLHTLVEEHNRGGKHLDLHQPVCVGLCKFWMASPCRLQYYFWDHQQEIRSNGYLNQFTATQG